MNLKIHIKKHLIMIIIIIHGFISRAIYVCGMKFVDRVISFTHSSSREPNKTFTNFTSALTEQDFHEDHDRVRREERHP